MAYVPLAPTSYADWWGFGEWMRSRGYAPTTIRHYQSLLRHAYAADILRQPDLRDLQASRTRILAPRCDDRSVRPSSPISCLMAASRTLPDRSMSRRNRIIDPYTNWIAAGERFDFDLDDVEEWLND
jgi:hypothetical protein